MKITKVKTNGQINLFETIKYNVSPRTNRAQRLTLSEMKNRAKRARRDVRFTNFY